MLRKPRACLPCHERKVKCNASHTGLPCTRCLKHGRVAACELVPLPNRSTALKRRPRPANDNHMVQEPRGLPVSAVANSSSRSIDRINENACRTPSAFYNSASRDSLPSLVSQGFVHLPRVTCPTTPLIEPAIGFKVPDCPAAEVVEEDCQLETCLKMAQTEDASSDLTSETSVSQAREVFAYHGGIDSTTILGQLLSHKEPRRFVKIKVYEPQASSDLNSTSMEYLQRVEAFTVPSFSICQRLIQLHFDRVYPYIPVLSRLSFMRKVSEGECSIFLLQCIFTSVTPYISKELLVTLGFADRAKAQRAFFSKAQLLYDLGAERSQLCLLQGSLILTSIYFSFGLDKDCRFWLVNAVRIATQMGLHRKQIADQLDRDTFKLVKRMFWAMYSRDVTMIMSGRINVRTLDDRYCDLPAVTKEDWEDEAEQELIHFKMSPVPILQKSHFVHTVQLARISGQYIDIFRCPSAPATRTACEDIEKQLTYWRRALPPELQPETVDRWSQENVWVLILRAMSYRLECLLYKDIQELPRLDQEQDARRRALQKQQNAMLELDSIFQRIMLHGLVGFCPFSMTTCASTVIAMHMECALNPGSTDIQRQLSRTSIHAGLAYLRECLQHWESVRWSLRMLDVVLCRSSLALTDSEHQTITLPSSHSRPGDTSTAISGMLHPGSLSVVAPEAANSTLVPPESDPAATSVPIHATSDWTEHELSSESMYLDSDLEGNLNDILVEDLSGANPMQAWAWSGI